MPPDPPGSPLWWVRRLEKKLSERRNHAELMTRYYTGDHPLPIPHERLRSAFARMLRQSRANWTGLVVDAVAERLHVVGFRLDELEADDSAWSLWQANELDAQSEQVHLEALICGESYVTIWNNPNEPQVPLILAEHASQMVTEADRNNPRELAAALKCWKDDWSGEQFSTLYLPDAIYKYRAPQNGGQWQERDQVLPNPLGVVPVVCFKNRPMLLSGGRSEIEDITDVQDRINKRLFDMAMAAEYSSFRQRYSIGMEIPVDTDGRPKAPFESAVDRLWMAEDPNVKFGEFESTDLGPYILAVEADIRAMAAISRTPPHYLLGAMVNISGDALKAAESGLSSKAASRTKQFGESWERVIRLAFAVLDDPKAKVNDSQVIWANVETRTEGETVDALVKMRTLGVPTEALWERWGASPQEIERWQTMNFQAALTSQALDLTGITATDLNGPSVAPIGVPGAMNGAAALPGQPNYLP